MSSVWVQLYYEGKGEQGNPTIIRPIPEYVADLAEAVKVKMAEELTHCSPARLGVYSPKSSGDKKKYNSYNEMNEVIAKLENTPPTSGKHALIVVAPAPLEQPANGKKHFGFVSFVIVGFI